MRANWPSTPTSAKFPKFTGTRSPFGLARILSTIDGDASSADPQFQCSPIARQFSEQSDGIPVEVFVPFIVIAGDTFAIGLVGIGLLCHGFVPADSKLVRAWHHTIGCQRWYRFEFGCHGLAPWRLTLAAI